MTVPDQPVSPGHPHLRINLRGAHIHHHLRGGPGRLRHRVLLVFAGVFAVIVGLGALGAAVGAPTNQPLCHPYRPCGPPKMMEGLVNQDVWRSTQYGFSLEYPGNQLQISQQDAGSLTLQADLGGGNTGTILIQGASVTAGSPAQAISRQLANLTGVGQLGPDPDTAHQLLGSSVGYQPGAGRASVGYFAAPQGVGQPVDLASEAASDGSITVSVTVGGPSGVTGSSSLLYALGDQIINSIRWPSDRSDTTPGSGAP